MSDRCNDCGKTFGQVKTLKKHVSEKYAEFLCEHCPLQLFGRKAYDKHVKTHGVKTGHKCTKCCKIFSHKDSLKKHRQSCSGGNALPSMKQPFTY